MAELRRIGGLPGPAVASDVWWDIWVEETHNSTAIEGNPLILKEVRALLEQAEPWGDKELRQYLEVKGLRGRGRYGCTPRPTTSRQARCAYLMIAELRRDPSAGSRPFGM